MACASAQSGRFRARLVADAPVVFPTLTRLRCAHANKDVRIAAEAALGAALGEVRAASDGS